ncbi:DUF2269 domain-containing protein [Undibacterium seohonense]|jgi:uncharacterized membrane protein|uniref:DUF2269 domain-containing protein n=1 Tax=Undibacterium seohonense TaxID=1344950 RepID=A0ABR6X4A5_9BURK|nr:DUF2269 domain-containing protein [Undibacterium seohonense]MBC3807523.1 DUF2269 domain-containing protein [Undibacterium seohonense]
MNTYLLLKTLHIISSVLLVGTGFGSAFYLYFTHRSKNVAAIATVSRLVVIADWCFTTPAVIIQPISGIAMVYLAGWPLDTPWILLSIILYLLAGACWLPVVWLQVKMKKMAETAYAQGEDLTACYWQYARYWERLGYPAFIAMLGVFYLMVNKPSLWG